MDKIDGGTLLPIAGFFIGSGRNQHTDEQRGPVVSQADLDATNHLQDTGRRVNRGTLQVALNAYVVGHPCLGADMFVEPPMPPRVSDADFTLMEPADRTKLSKDRRKGRQAVSQWRAEKARIGELLTISKADVVHPSMWTVFGHDARLRRYPCISSGPNPQGDGLSRGLLEFDTGVELGHRGLWWLAVRAGTAAGLDKKPHQERAEWADRHTDDLRACARDPLGVDFWWRDADGKGRDDPWALLATAMEIDAALSAPQPAGFKSRLPVHVDGTCNGLQHLSAMGLDPVGALATNLTASPERHDIYEIVAEKVRARVAVDAAGGLEAAQGWIGKVERNTVKRACMTTPYGVTARGMRDQLVDDGFVADEDHEDVSAAAGYLRDVLWVAIGEVVVSARNTMDWLQTTAGALAEHNVPLQWMTPAGSSIRQAYRPSTSSRPLTAFGRIHLAGETDKSSLKARKCALGAAPNFVHSFDAAHMALTVNAGSSLGITHWDTIHDSYGTHAARMDTLNAVLRQEFRDIYRDDWLLTTHEALVERSPWVDLKPPPARGEFNIDEVLESAWFFA